MLLILLAWSVQAAAQAPQAVLPETGHDFGLVKQGEKLSHLFTLNNTGDSPLSIEDVALDVPGVRAVYTPTVPPHGSRNIKIEWNTALTHGPVEGKLSIRTNAPGAATITFAFKAVITPPIEIRPLPAAFFSVFEGQSKDQVLEIVNHEDTPLVIERLDPQSEHFTARIETVDPGKVLRLHMHVPSGVAPGRYMEAVSLYTNQPQRQPIRVPVNVLVKREIHMDPEIIDFGTIPLQALDRTPALLNALAQIVTLNKREGEFEILSVESDVPALEILKAPSGSSNRFQLDIQPVRERLTPGPLTGTIRVHTNDRTFGTLVIQVRGAIQ